MELKNIKSLTIIDERNYVAGKGNNGGCYRFFEDYSRNNPGENFIVTFDTSSEFDYCKVQGAFQSCDGCLYNQEVEEGIYKCTEKFHEITEQELQEYINNLQESEYVSHIEEF